MQKIVMMVMWLGASVFAGAAEPVAEDQRKADDIAEPPAVLTWLDMQRSGTQASKVPQTLTPVIQERVVKRYLDSFNAPIPVFFADESSAGATSSVTR